MGRHRSCRRSANVLRGRPSARRTLNFWTARAAERAPMATPRLTARPIKKLTVSRQLSGDASRLPMPDRLRPLILSRRPREIGLPWVRYPSWFGGKPRLGDRPWPRCATSGRPMYFLAQIDLEEIAGCIGSSALPAAGALAFFIGEAPSGPEAGVIYVPHPRVAAPTEPPPDAPAVFDLGGDIFPENAAPSAPRLFPHWPLEISALPLDEDGSIDADAVTARWQRRQYFFTAREAWTVLGEAAAHPAWWHTAQLFAAHLRAAHHHWPSRVERQRASVVRARADLEKVRPKPTFSAVLGRIFGRRSALPSPDVEKAEKELARCEKRLAGFEQLTPAFERFVADVSAWAGEHRPWQSMSAEAVMQLKTSFDRSRKEFDEVTRYRVPHSVADLATQTLLALMVAEDERDFALLPGAIRTLINEKYRLPTDAWHQMFGQGVSIQDNARLENEGSVLLLQLVYDDMMAWRFGDMGAYQFWIPPQDLATGNWRATRLTFECH